MNGLHSGRYRLTPWRNASGGSGRPLVLIHEGIADRRMYDDQMAVFAARYRVIRPNAQFRLIPQAGHFPWLEQPAAMAASLRAFLRRL